MSRRNRLYLIWIFIIVLFFLLPWLHTIEQEIIKQQKQESLQKLPRGWQIIMPEEDIMAITSHGDYIWVGGRDGLYKLNKRNKELIEKIEFNSEVTYVRDLLVDSKNNLWVAYDGGIVIYDEINPIFFHTGNGLPDNRVNVLFEDSTYRIWAGTWKGAAVYDYKHWKIIKADDGLGANMVNEITEVSDGFMWFGSSSVPNGAVSIYDGKDWTYFTTVNGLSHNNINDIQEMEKGTVLVGTGFYDKGGLVTFTHQERWSIDNKRFKNLNWLYGKKITSIYRDRTGAIWFGSEYDGIAVLRNNDLVVLTEEDGLSNQEVKTIFEDDEGGMWLGTPAGITFISPLGLKEINDSK